MRHVVLTSLLSLSLWCGCEAPRAPLDEDRLARNYDRLETEGHPDCDGLDPSYCMFPFPSDYWRRNGRLEFGETTLPQNRTHKHFDPSYYRQYDGYSTISVLMFRFPEATLAGTADQFTIAKSLEPDSKSVVLDAATGERVPHWLELDHFSVDGGQPVILIRLARPLQFGTRYIVAIRGLVDRDDEPVRPRPGFRALRDRSASRVIGIHARRAHFEEAIFPPLERAGVERSRLQLAWDFTTLSETSSTSLLLSMRDKLLAELGPEGPDYEITEVVDYPADDPGFARTVKGVAHVPSFLVPRTKGLYEVQKLRRDAGGDPQIEGYEDVEFEIHIPRSVLASDEPVPVMQHGHGFLGDKVQATREHLREFSNRKGFIIVAISMQGMSELDGVRWVSWLANSASRFPELLEPPLQGVMNHLAIVRMLKGRFLTESDPRFTHNGKPLYDPERIVYYGNSQGGTMGALMMSIRTGITRGVLGVPGGVFAFLLQRSVDFTTFVPVLRAAHPNIVDFTAIFALMQQGFNHMEPVHFMPRLTVNPYPNTPSHLVMLHIAKEDAQVVPEVSHILGRACGAKLPVPAIRHVFGFDEVEFPIANVNTMIEYDFGVPDNPRPTYPPPKATDTHGLLRKLVWSQDQMWHFLMTGETINTCDGPCDPD
ncbi:MAG: hypothetical protein KC609_21925 [Myxococcales bacterium]|nr:hypothetical protein [Myxococcales bacterium]